MQLASATSRADAASAPSLREQARSSPTPKRLVSSVRAAENAHLALVASNSNEPFFPRCRDASSCVIKPVIERSQSLSRSAIFVRCPSCRATRCAPASCSQRSPRHCAAPCATCHASAIVLRSQTLMLHRKRYRLDHQQNRVRAMPMRDTAVISDALTSCRELASFRSRNCRSPPARACSTQALAMPRHATPTCPA